MIVLGDGKCLTCVGTERGGVFRSLTVVHGLRKIGGVEGGSVKWSIELTSESYAPSSGLSYGLRGTCVTFARAQPTRWSVGDGVTEPRSGVSMRGLFCGSSSRYLRASSLQCWIILESIVMSPNPSPSGLMQLCGKSWPNTGVKAYRIS